MTEFFQGAKNQPSADSRTKSHYLYFFRDDKTGSLYETQAVNSDQALLKCLYETKWRMETILYEGKEPVPLRWGDYFRGPA